MVTCTRFRQLRCFASVPQMSLLPESVRQRVFKTPPLCEAETARLDKAVAEAARWVSGNNGASSSTFSREETLEMPPEGPTCLHRSSDLPIFDLPDLEGESIIEHFEKIGQQFVEKYEAIIIQGLLRLEDSLHCKRPKTWSMESGWTEYKVLDGNVVGKQCEGPVMEILLVFDVEVNVATSRHLPILATAFAPLSGTWYSWTSEKLWNEKLQVKEEEDVYDYLIPIRDASTNAEFRQQPLIVVGHNVGFDRQYIKDEYTEATKFCTRDGVDLGASTIRFVDTMAMHQAVAGLTQVRERGANEYNSWPQHCQGWCQTGRLL